MDPPHDGDVIAVKFRPSNCGEHQTPLAVTVGVEGKFKIWTLGEETVIRGKLQTKLYGCVFFCDKHFN